MAKEWTCGQSGRLRETLRESELMCEERANRERDQWSRDAELFRSLAFTFRMLRSKEENT